ncbi:MAG: translation initiation factor IF-3 [Abditibacteriota bacterium]|nr:translation initiation factor IF-3 [Abditibacteriota bacterium]
MKHLVSFLRSSGCLLKPPAFRRDSRDDPSFRPFGPRGCKSIFWRTIISKEKELNINERIRAPQVRLIGADDEQIGIVPVREALQYAKEKGLDLIEIAPQANPPVCRVMDYGKFKYDMGKKKKEAAKKQKQVEIKTIRFRPHIEEHDFDVKVSAAKKFLGQGNKVKISLMFRSREASHPEIAIAQLEKLAQIIVESGSGKLEKKPSMEGKFMNMILAPTE